METCVRCKVPSVQSCKGFKRTVSKVQTNVASVGSVFNDTRKLQTVCSQCSR